MYVSDRPTENECRTEAVFALRAVLESRYVLRTELKLPRGMGGSKRGARLDMAILDRETSRILLIIETKRSSRSKATGQGERYSRMAGAPVVYLRGIEACRQAAGPVLAALEGKGGVVD